MSPSIHQRELHRVSRKVVSSLLFLCGTLTSFIGAPIEAKPNSTPGPPRIVVHRDGHMLQTDDGRPFFWMGDTAWELIHRTTREECSYYLHSRGQQGFNVIQTVVLAEFDGILQPTALGDKPFLDGDPKRPNDAYFDRVVQIVDEAATQGLYVALVPVWGDKLTAPWGKGPRIFRLDNLGDAEGYTHYLGKKLEGRTNVVWMLGGDRPPRVDHQSNEYLRAEAKRAGFPEVQDWTPIWRSLAKGIAEGTGETPLILYHPQGGPDSSSVYLHDEPWLSINGIQSGHGGGHDVPVWEWIARDYAKSPAKPTLDLEPNYEDHPYNPWPQWDPATGYFRDLDVRKQVYRSVLAGACGVTYGHHAIWPFIGGRNEAINHTDRDWIDALHRPAGTQMIFLRELVESRPVFRRIPDQSLLVGDAGSGGLHLQAARDSKGTYAFIYFPASDLKAKLNLTRLSSPKVRAWWYDPRSGVGTSLGIVPATPESEFVSPPYGPDWVLVLDDPAAHYPPPGLGLAVE